MDHHHHSFSMDISSSSASPGRTSSSIIDNRTLFTCDIHHTVIPILSIDDTELRTDTTGKAYTVYNIHVKTCCKEWVVCRRYSEFCRFHSSLVLLFPDIRLPTLPPKRLFGSSLQPGVIGERREKLSEVLGILAREPVVLNSNVFTAFLQGRDRDATLNEQVYSLESNVDALSNRLKHYESQLNDAHRRILEQAAAFSTYQEEVAKEIQAIHKKMFRFEMRTRVSSSSQSPTPILSPSTTASPDVDRKNRTKSDWDAVKLPTTSNGYVLPPRPLHKQPIRWMNNTKRSVSTFSAVDSTLPSLPPHNGSSPIPTSNVYARTNRTISLRFDIDAIDSATEEDVIAARMTRGRSASDSQFFTRLSGSMSPHTFAHNPQAPNGISIGGGGGGGGGGGDSNRRRIESNDDEDDDGESRSSTTVATADMNHEVDMDDDDLLNGEHLDGIVSPSLSPRATATIAVDVTNHDSVRSVTEKKQQECRQQQQALSKAEERRIVLVTGTEPVEKAPEIMLDQPHWNDQLNLIVACLCPQPDAVNLRMRVVEFVTQRLESEGARVFTHGSYALKTYLPDGDIDMSAFFTDGLEDSDWNRRLVVPLLGARSDTITVNSVLFVANAEVPVIKCDVNGVRVDITENRLSGLASAAFFEQVDRAFGKSHLFKRTMILLKAWALNEAKILDSINGFLSTYCLQALILFVFNCNHSRINKVLDALYIFFEYFRKFDWHNHSLGLFGPHRLDALPQTEIVVDGECSWPVGAQPLVTQHWLKEYSTVYHHHGRTVSRHQPRSFQRLSFNVVDPTNPTNNLGRTVQHDNVAVIHQAFVDAYECMREVVERRENEEAPSQNDIDVWCEKFFANTKKKYKSRFDNALVNAPTVWSMFGGELRVLSENVRIAKEFDVPHISEGELVGYIAQVLMEHGTVDVGRLGSLLHSMIYFHTLPSLIKTRFGGLKKLVQRHSQLFVVGTNHKFNPQVSLRQTLTNATSLNGGSIASSHYAIPPSSMSIPIPVARSSSHSQSHSHSQSSSRSRRSRNKNSKQRSQRSQYESEYPRLLRQQ